MGSLLDVKIPFDEVPADDGTMLTLHGLNPMDVSVLMCKHGAALSGIYKETLTPFFTMMANAQKAQGGSGDRIMTQNGVENVPMPELKVAEGSQPPPPDDMVRPGTAPDPTASLASDALSPDKILENPDVMAVIDDFDPSMLSVDSLLSALTGTAPQAVADIIALSNRSYGQGGEIKAAELSLPCQWHCLSVIAALSFSSEKHVEKMVGVLVKILQAMKEPQADTPPSPQP